MSDQSTNLELPFLVSGQAQKHVTVNEALLRLDALTQLCVESTTLAAQPTSPSDGARYVLPAGKTGAEWGAMADSAVAYYRDGVWEEITPREGWIAFARDTDLLHVHGASSWALARTFLGLGSAALVADTALAHLAGAETFTGAKSFSAGVTLSSTLHVASAITGLRAEFGGGNSNGYVMRVQHGGSNHGIALGSRTSGSLHGFIQGLRNDGGDVRGIVLQPSGGKVYVGASETEVFHAGATPLPATDNAINLGSASFRFGTVYAATGAINTSDAREKTPLEPLPDAAKRAALRALGSCGAFQWRDAISAKGSAARLHVGVTAQAVRDAFAAEGEDPERWALFCRDIIETADGARIERLGVRTDQLLLLGLAAMLQC